MWRVTTIALVSLAELLVAAPAIKDPPKKDSPIVGKWRIVSSNGRNVSYLKEDTFRADGTMMILMRLGKDKEEVELRCQYSVDLTADPIHIDFTQDNGERTSRGIFKVDGDTLTICFRDRRGPRPDKFGESDATTVTYERVKPKE